MKKLTLSLMALMFVVSLSSRAARAEEWKGTPEDSEFSAGFLTGLGILDGNASLPLLGTFSKKIIHHGFVDDISDTVSIEAELGPQFVNSTTVFTYSAHLRWDFNKDADWTIYGLGGLAGIIGGSSFANQFRLYPRFGIGALWHITNVVSLRGELSHEWIALGVNVPLWK